MRSTRSERRGRLEHARLIHLVKVEGAPRLAGGHRPEAGGGALAAPLVGTHLDAELRERRRARRAAQVDAGRLLGLV